jgi:hypothetical protein
MRTFRIRFTLLPLVAMFAALLLAPSVADAAPTSAYGHLRITYRNASTYRWAVNEAFAVWGRAGTPYTFVPARPGTRADITITQKPYIGSPNSSVAGFGGVGFVQLSVARMKSPKAYDPGKVKIVAHEIGHALGLPHVANPCALMYSALDFASRTCTTVEQRLDARVFCGPRGMDVLALGRMYRFTPLPRAWRGYCTAPTDPAKAATGPYVAGTLTAASPQSPGGNVMVTVTNTGNTTFDIASLGVVLVDSNGALLTHAWPGDWYRAIITAPAPGASIEVPLAGCSAAVPYVMHVRLASILHDAYLSPVTDIRVDDPEGDPSVPANECANAA